MKKRIVIADDHRLVIEGIAGLLISTGEYEIVGRAGNGAEALRLIRRLKPDLAVLDITMPEMDGIDAARAVRAELPEVRILVLSVHKDLRMIMEVIKAGADGYALKEAEPDELINAVKTVLAGDIYLDSKITTLLVRDYIRKLNIPSIPEARRGDLSPMECEIVALVAEGLDAYEIAKKLCITRNTVDAHRRNIMRKLDCKNLRELTSYALYSGLVNLDEE